MTEVVTARSHGCALRTVSENDNVLTRFCLRFFALQTLF